MSLGCFFVGVGIFRVGDGDFFSFLLGNDSILDCDMINLLGYMRDNSLSAFFCCDVDYIFGCFGLLES